MELAAPPKWRASPLPLLGRFVRRGRQYAKLVFWLLRKAFRGEMRTLALVTVLSVLYLVGQAAALYTIYWYGMQIQVEAAETVQLLGMSLPATDSATLLWLVVVVTASCFILSAIVLFFSRSAIFRLVEKDYGRGLEFIANMAARLPDPRAPLASRLLVEYKRGGIASGCRRGALTSIAFSQAIPPMVAGLAASGLLMWIDAWLTLSIVMAAIVWATFLYPVTLRAVAFAFRREAAQAAYREEADRLPRHGAEAQDLTPLKSAPELAQAYVGRRRVMNEMALITEIGATAIVALAILQMASQVMAGAENWPIFIAYIGALRLALAGGFQGVRAFASVSRFYPTIIRYFEFTQDLRDLQQLSMGQVTRGDPVSLGSLPDGSDVAVEAGDRMALLAASAPMPALRLAFLGSKAGASRLPLDVAVLGPDELAAPPDRPAAIALIETRAIKKLIKTGEAMPDEALKDMVTLVVHREPSEIGRFGETHLLIMEDDALTCFELLGTPEADELIAVFAPSPPARPTKPSNAEDEDEDDDPDL